MNHPNSMPRIAVIDSNTLSILGMKQILQQVAPMVEVVGFNSLNEFLACPPDSFYHYFVNIGILINHRNIFADKRHKTIVLTTSQEPEHQLSGFHSLCTNQNEKLMLKELLLLMQSGHHSGKNLPQPLSSPTILTPREIEVMSLVVQGLINKEIAERLNISMNTVITHRKNVMDKLGLRSVSALTIYAVMHGFVDIHKI